MSLGINSLVNSKDHERGHCFIYVAKTIIVKDTSNPEFQIGLNCPGLTTHNAWLHFL